LKVAVFGRGDEGGLWEKEGVLLKHGNSQKVIFAVKRKDTFGERKDFFAFSMRRRVGLFSCGERLFVMGWRALFMFSYWLFMYHFITKREQKPCKKSLFCLYYRQPYEKEEDHERAWESS